MNDKTIDLGCKLRDTLTGFTGAATGRAEYVNGCVQYCLETVGSDGKIINQWFDDARLEAAGTNPPMTIYGERAADE